MSYEEELDALQNTFDKKVTALANKVRRELIIPACKKHGLKFYSGMGMYFFSKDGETLAPDAPGVSNLLEKYKLVSIFKVLDIEVIHNQYLGDWVSDYIPPALNKKPHRLTA